MGFDITFDTNTTCHYCSKKATVVRIKDVFTTKIRFYCEEHNRMRLMRD